MASKIFEIDDYINTKQRNPLDELIYKESVELFQKTISTLTEREKVFVELYWFSLRTSYIKIGICSGISSERARQIISVIIRKLRCPKRANKLKELIDE